MTWSISLCKFDFQEVGGRSEFAPGCLQVNSINSKSQFCQLRICILTSSIRNQHRILVCFEFTPRPPRFHIEALVLMELIQLRPFKQIQSGWSGTGKHRYLGDSSNQTATQWAKLHSLINPRVLPDVCFVEVRRTRHSEFILGSNFSQIWTEIRNWRSWPVERTCFCVFCSCSILWVFWPVTDLD